MRVIPPNALASSPCAIPIGHPIRRMRGPRRSAGSLAAVMPKRRRSRLRSTYSAAAANMHQRTMLVAIAAPSAPRAGNPPWPKTSSQFRPTFSTFAPMMITIPGTGRPMPSRKKTVATYSSIPGSPNPSAARTRPPPAAMSSGCPVASRNDSPNVHATAIAAPATAACPSAVRQIAPQRSGLPAPTAWAVITMVPISSPIPHQHQRDLRCDGDRVPGEIVSGRVAAHGGVHGDDRQHPEPGEHDGKREAQGLAQVRAQGVRAGRHDPGGVTADHTRAANPWLDSPTRHSRSQMPVANLGARASRPQHAGGVGFSAQAGICLPEARASRPQAGRKPGGG